VGLVRVLRGPGNAERMMAAQLIGSGGIACLLTAGIVTSVAAATAPPPRAREREEARGLGQAGAMFWFVRKRFCGSYVRFTWARRA
jgi:hypothetical protein